MTKEELISKLNLCDNTSEEWKAIELHFKQIDKTIDLEKKKSKFAIEWRDYYEQVGSFRAVVETRQQRDLLLEALKRAKYLAEKGRYKNMEDSFFEDEIKFINLAIKKAEG